MTLLSQRTSRIRVPLLDKRDSAKVDDLVEGGRQ